MLQNGLLYRRPDKGSNDSPRRVIPACETFDRIVQVHHELGHAGYKRTHSAIHQRYYGISQPEVAWLVARCQTCLLNRGNKSKGPLKPIISNAILEWVQIDLINMRHEPDGQYKWILHVVDHFSKYTCLFALKSKRAVEVADEIATLLSFFEPPKIMQCDNGREFKGVLLVLLKEYGIRVVNGCPRNPSTQGLVEQANGTIKMKLRCWMHDNNSPVWHLSLPRIALAMNLSTHGATGKMPYEIMFGRKPRWEDSTKNKECGSGSSDHIEDEVINGTTDSDTASPDEIVHIGEYMNDYTFDFDIPNSIALSTVQENINNTSQDHRPTLTPRPAILSETSTLVLLPVGPPPPIPPRPAVSLSSNTLLLHSHSDSSTSTILSTPTLQQRPIDSVAPTPLPLSLHRSSSPLSTPPESPVLSENQHPSAETETNSNHIQFTELEKQIQQRNVKVRMQMQKKHRKQHIIEQFVPDDLVTLKIPREDRAATDNLRIFCRVIAELRPNRYQLLTKHGILQNCYPTKELLRIPEQARESVDAQIPPLAHATTGIAKPISLHAASAKESHSTRIGISCNCKDKCTGRCRCKKNQVQCSVHCHSDEHNCGNLAPLRTRTELALVERQQETEAEKNTTVSTRPVQASVLQRKRRLSTSENSGRRVRQRRKQ